MSRTEVRPRPSAAARRVGFGIAAAINLAMLWLIHVWPGWDAVPFLSGETPRVLGAIDATLIAAVVVNVLQVVWQPRWMAPLSAGVTSAFGLAAMIVVYQVFPFVFTGGVNWALVVRILLILSIVGTAIALLVNVVSLMRPQRWARVR